MKFLFTVLVVLCGANSYGQIAGSVFPLQRNPYNQPNIIARAANGSLNIRNPQTGGYMSRYIPYYTSSVYQAMKTRAADNNMRLILRSIMMSAHTSHTGAMDTVSERCAPGDKNCYVQTPLGYERARLFLMGYFYWFKSAINTQLKKPIVINYTALNSFQQKAKVHVLNLFLTIA